ncbi:MAG: hypothetical protein F6K62_15790 [Sphaerospermopsis sp. SIO1G2]|nr:hypothetical protein [Sphaerospermopsis sp. SIO1G2]
MGEVKQSKTQRKLKVFVGFLSLTQPANQDIFDFGKDINIMTHNFVNLPD